MSIYLNSIMIEDYKNFYEYRMRPIFTPTSTIKTLFNANDSGRIHTKED